MYMSQVDCGEHQIIPSMVTSRGSIFVWPYIYSTYQDHRLLQLVLEICEGGDSGKRLVTMLGTIRVSLDENLTPVLLGQTESPPVYFSGW